VGTAGGSLVASLVPPLSLYDKSALLRSASARPQARGPCWQRCGAVLQTGGGGESATTGRPGRATPTRT
jgi:hypothetical protein